MGTFLVTGGTGQIGSFLCEELVSRGEAVLCCDVKPNMSNIASLADRISVEAVDISNPDDLFRLTRSHKVDCILHLAAIVLLDSMKDPPLAYRVNIVGTNNVLEAARQLDVKKVVFASSVLVYGSAKSENVGIVNEDDFPNPPPDPYSTSKMAGELMGRYYRDAYGMDVNCLRITAAWGPGRYTGYTGSFNDYVRSVATGQAPTFPANFAYKDAKLRWLYVKDVSRAFVRAATVRKPARYLYNTGSRSPFSASDVVSSLNSIFPSRHLVLTPMEKPTEISSSVAGPNGLDVDCSRLYEELGFESKFSLQTALMDMVNHERRLANEAPAPASPGR
jgi:UDP-glucose 4-epimerase